MFSIISQVDVDKIIMNFIAHTGKKIAMDKFKIKNRKKNSLIKIMILLNFEFIINIREKKILIQTNRIKH